MTTSIVPEKEEMKGKEYVMKREAGIREEDAFTRIYKYYHNPKKRIELNVREEAMRDRLERAWLLLSGLKTTKQVADEIQTMCNVSRAQAYDDVRNAMHLFGDPKLQNKEAKRAIAETNYLWGAEKARSVGDLEMHAKYMELYAKINGLHEPDASTNMEDLVKKFKPVQIVIVARREDLEAEIKAIQDEVIDITHKDVEDR
jgi:hypothetical protein